MVNPEYSVSQPQSPVSKKEYLATLASPKAKNAAKFAKIAALVCVVIMVIGYFTALNTSIEDVPIMSMALGAAGDKDDFDDVKESAQDMMDEVEENMDDHEDELKDILSDKEYKKLDKFVDILSDTTKTISINNLKRLASAIDNMNEEAAELLNLDDSSDDMDEVMEILSTVSTVLLVFLIITLVFTVLGALCRANGLVVVGAILTTIYCLVFCGVLFVILNLVAHIAVIYLQGQVKKEYKAYRAGTLNA